MFIFFFFFFRYLENIKPKSVLEEEFKQLREHLEALHSPIVFCHNDLLVNNLIYNKEEGIAHYSLRSCRTGELTYSFFSWTGLIL